MHIHVHLCVQVCVAYVYVKFCVEVHSNINVFNQ